MPRIRTVESLAEIEEEFVARAHEAVWCSVATVDARGRPRSRLLHPIWEGATGWILTFRNSPKSDDLARNPHASLAYVAHVERPVYAECLAAWVGDLGEKARVWEIFRTTPSPLGYDPAPTFGGPDHPNFGLLRLTPWRVQLNDSMGEARVWRLEG